MLAFQGEAAIEQAPRQIGFDGRRALVQHREKALLAPFGGALRIHEQPAWPRLEKAALLVDRRSAGAARDAFPRAELELAGRVVAAVAHHAAPLEDRPDLRVGRHA